MSGGVSLIGFVAMAVALLFLPILAPVVLGGALVIGLGDIYLDVRGRMAELALNDALEE
jgi:hypothetical protein